MDNLKMIPDEYEMLQKLLLKVGEDLGVCLENKNNARNLNGQSKLYYFLNDLKGLIQSNRNLLEDDLYMNLHHLRKKLADNGSSN